MSGNLAFEQKKANYFLTTADGELPRRVPKNSDDEGSTNITSLLLLKLALYASKLR